MPASELTLEGEAAPEILARVHEVLAELWRRSPEVDDLLRIRMDSAVGELVANVVEHGRTPDGATPTLRLSLAVDEAEVVAELVDDGVQFPPHPRTLEDLLAESGRGLAIVHEAVDEARYEHRDGANRWRLVLRRPS